MTSSEHEAARTTPLAVKALIVVLLLLLALAGLRGAVAAPHWNGPLHQAGAGIGIVLEIVLAALLTATIRRGRGKDPQADPVAHKLRTVLKAVQSAGIAAVAIATIAGLHLRLFGKYKPPKNPIKPVKQKAPHALSQPGSSFSVPIAAILYALLILALVAAVVISIWWARRLRRALPGPPPEPFADDEEALRDAVASGAAALRTIDDTRLAIISCYAAMERSLAERGAERGVADTPDELLARAKDRGLVRGAAAATLTALFYEARFSSHPLERDQRDAAEQALHGLAASLEEEPAST